LGTTKCKFQSWELTTRLLLILKEAILSTLYYKVDIIL
jgi:hypothetical protein